MSQTLYFAALNKALSLLSRKTYSEQEIREKLKKYDYDDQIINNALDYLTGKGYLNDFRLCQNLFDKFTQNNSYGYRLVQARLTERKLPGTMICEVMKRYDFDGEAGQALDLIKKRYKLQAEPVRSELEKIARYLTSRGFSSSSVSKVIDWLKREEYSDEE